MIVPRLISLVPRLNSVLVNNDPTSIKKSRILCPIVCKDSIRIKLQYLIPIHKESRKQGHLKILSSGKEQNV